MTTEDIQIQDGRIVVERVEYKANVDVAVSDVDSISFTASGTDGSKPGALVLHTKDGDQVIRVDDEDAGEVLTAFYAVINKGDSQVGGVAAPAEESTVDNSDVAKDQAGNKPTSPKRR